MGDECRPTVLVTGGSSRIGHTAVRHLGSRCRFVFLVNRRPPPAAGADARVLPGGLSAVATHADAIRSADVVLHMAGVSHARDEETYADSNDRGTRALLDVCRTDQPVVYLSTRCSGIEGGAYGRSKHRAEQAIIASGRPYVIIRPAEVYDSKAGEGIDALIDLALRRRVLLDFRWRPGVRYSPVSAEELGRFIADVASGDLSHAATIYTVCNSRSYTAADMQAALERGLGQRVRRVPVPVGVLRTLQRLRLPLPFAPDQIDRLVMVKPDDSSPARRDYGFSPRCFLEYLADRGREAAVTAPRR